MSSEQFYTQVQIFLSEEFIIAFLNTATAMPHSWSFFLLRGGENGVDIKSYGPWYCSWVMNQDRDTIMISLFKAVWKKVTWNESYNIYSLLLSSTVGVRYLPFLALDTVKKDMKWNTKWWPPCAIPFPPKLRMCCSLKSDGPRNTRVGARVRVVCRCLTPGRPVLPASAWLPLQVRK